MTVQVQEFSDAESLLAHYKAMKARQRYAPPPFFPKEPEPAPVASNVLVLPTGRLSRHPHRLLGKAFRPGKPAKRGRVLYAKPIGPVPVARDFLIVASNGFGVARGIVAQVCAKHHLSKEELIATTRRAYITQARQEACYRLRTETLLSLKQIANHLGGLDHTTVLHGVRRHTARLAEGSAL